MSKNLKNSAAALKLEYAMEHHAKPLVVIKRALQDALHYSGIMHSIISVQGGVQSWRLDLADGRKFELRGRLLSGPLPYISARQQGTKTEVRMSSPRDAARFVESL